MRFRQRRVRSRTFYAVCGAIVLIVPLLCYTESVRLWFRFVCNQLDKKFQPVSADQAWLHQPPKFHVDIFKDVGLVIKTGYGTQHRISAALTALEKGFASQDLIVVSDFSPQRNLKYSYNGHNVEIFDVLATSLESGSLKRTNSTPRLKSYLDMASAIARSDLTMALEMGKRIGWELDAMKFIPGLQLAFNLMPQKKWYILLDDDSYLIKSSMVWLLQHLDPNIPHYIGNPVGDFKGRFAHGGSSVILSRPVLHELFAKNPGIVLDAYSRSLTETWGDKLLATTLMKIGIHLNERYEPLFNGASPLNTRIWSNRLCLPIVSFHQLGDPQIMQELGDLLKNVDDTVYWNDIWKIYQGSDIDSLLTQPIRKDKDHVGETDPASKTFEHIQDAEGCLEACKRHEMCIAWTWDSKSGTCNVSPWMMVGHTSPGKFSGLHATRVREHLARC